MSGIASAAIALGTAIYGGVTSAKARRAAERKEKAAAANRMMLEANRQDIPDFQQDMLNPYANLQVATQASAMQAEQADISLASTLDTLRATGASAGGATALARAAAQSKRGVSAQIEQQEARNAQLRAQGEMQAAQMRQRGQIYSAQMQEARDTQQLNRQASLESSYNQQATAYKAQQSQAIGQAVGAVGSFAAAGGFGKQGPFSVDSQGVRRLTNKEVKTTTAEIDKIQNPGFDQSALDAAMTDINAFTGENDLNLNVYGPYGLTKETMFTLKNL